MLDKTIPRELPINIEDFSSKYNVSRNAIWVKISNGSFPKEIMLNKGIVNEAWFLRRWAFIRYVQETNQDLIYLLEEEFSLVEIAKTIAKKYNKGDTSIKEYLSHALFCTPGENIKIATKVHSRAWSVFKYANLINNKLKRRGTSIEKMLDKRMKKSL